MASGPNVHGSLEKYLSNQQTRVTLLERRLALQGGGGNNVVMAPAFMTPTSVSGGTFDPVTGRITLTPGATGVQVNGVFSSQYRAYKIYFGWYTGAANGLVIRLASNGIVDQTAVYEYAASGNSGNTAFGAENNTQTFWGLAAIARTGHAGEITVFEPMTTEYTNNQKRYVATCTAYGDAVAVFGGIMAGRDTVAFDGFTILNSAAGPGVTAVSGSWVMVVPVPTSQVPVDSGGAGGGGRFTGDIWEIGNDSVPPAGTLLCDGRMVSRTTYAELFAKIGTTYGDGDGSTTFNLPCLNGKQVRAAGVAAVNLDGLFPQMGQGSSQYADAWEIFYTLDSNITTAELRMQLRSGGANITAAAYFHTRDGYAATSNLQQQSTGQTYVEPSWGAQGNGSGSIRIWRAGQPSHWTNFESTTANRGGAYPEAVVQMAGSLQQASKVDGISLYMASGLLNGNVTAIPVGGSLTPSVIAYTNTGGASIPVSVPNKGTTAERDAVYPLPVNTTQQVALHNQKIQWQNTEKGWTEQYYAPSTLAGVNFPGLFTGFPAGWYPIAGSDLRVHRGKTNGFQATAAGANTEPVLAASQINHGGWVDSGNGGVIPPVGGFYEIQARGYFSTATAMSYVASFVFRAGSPVMGDRRYHSGADTNTDARVVLDVQAGQVISLICVSQGANNVWGTSGYDGCFLAVRYAGPPIVNG